MSAIKKTMEWIGFRDAGTGELEEFDSEETIETPDFAPATPSFDSVAQFPTSRRLTSVKSTPASDLRRILSVTPRTYNEAKAIGDSFKKGVPVVMNLESMSENEARRMVDFASGLIYGLNGSIERVTNRVFLLTPETVQIEETAGGRSDQGSIFNQS